MHVKRIEMAQQSVLILLQAMTCFTCTLSNPSRSPVFRTFLFSIMVVFNQLEKQKKTKKTDILTLLHKSLAND